MSKIFWDTNQYVYLFEGLPEFAIPTRALRERMIERRDELITSTMTLAEVQVKALRQGNTKLAHSFRDAIRGTSRIVAFDEVAADTYALLRVNQAIKPADAIQLACAAAVGVELFITNDKDLQKLTIPGIHFICSVQRAPI